MNREKPAATVGEYLARVPEPARTTLKTLRAEFKRLVPETREVISYQMPAFRLERGLMCYAAFKNHCSVFPGARVIAALAADLKDYKTSKGTIQFPLDRPLPARLIKKIVKARLAEIAQQKLKAKSRRRSFAPHGNELRKHSAHARTGG